MHSETLVETDRLAARRFRRDDLGELYRLVYADPLVKDAWSGATGTAQEIKQRFAQRYIDSPGELGLCAVLLKRSQLLIGLMGFQLHEADEGEAIDYLQSEAEPGRRVGCDPHFPEAELTYALGREHWRRGYASEIGRAFIVYGFERLRLGRIIQGVRASNAGSVGLMRRLGFRVETGTLPDQVVGIIDDYPGWRRSQGL